MLLLWAGRAGAQPMPVRPSPADGIQIDPSVVVDQWTVENGLPVNNVVKVIQSREGYIWLATFDGLVRFDGVRFVSYHSADNPGLPSNRLVNLQESPDGILWLETEQHYLVAMKDGLFNTVGHGLLADNRSRSSAGDIGNLSKYNGSTILATIDDSSGDFWFGSDAGINRYSDGVMSPYEPDMVKDAVDRIFVEQGGALWFRNRKTLAIYRIENGRMEQMIQSTLPLDLMAMAEQPDGVVWLGVANSVYRYENGLLTKFDGFERPNTLAMLVSLDPEGRLWLLTSEDGFYYADKDRLQPFEGSRGEVFSHFKGFFTDPDGNFWMFSKNGVWKNRRLIFHSPISISSFFMDTEGSMWLGTLSDGLLRIKDNPFTTFSTPEGLSNRNVYPIVETMDGAVLIGTHGDGLSMIREGTITNRVGGPAIGDIAYIRSLYELSSGDILIGKSGDGLFRIDRKTLQARKVDQHPRLRDAVTTSIIEYPKDTVWLGTDHGLFQWSGDFWKDYEFVSQVRDFTVSPDGAMWMATSGHGLMKYHNGHFSAFGVSQGFKSNTLRSIFITGDASRYVLWVGSEDYGLLSVAVVNGKPDPEQVTQYSTHNGLPDHAVHTLIVDDSGNAWLNTNRGIFVVEFSQLEALQRGEISTLVGSTFTERDGLRNREGNGGVRSAGMKASDGRIWLPTQDGAVVIDPERVKRTAFSPPIVVEEVRTPDSLFVMSRTSYVDLAADQRNFEVRFTALGYLHSDKILFRYRLDGFDPEWIDAGERRTVSYTNVPPGKYTFRVQATEQPGVWPENEASFEVRIEPFFYERGWFYVVVAGLLIGFGYVVFSVRLRSLQRSEQRLIQQVGERTAELSAEKEKTEAQAERLKEIDQAKSRFFANISHELRTPLTLMTAPLEEILATDQHQFDPRTLDRLKLMKRNGERLANLVDQTLELVHLDHGKVILSRAPVDLCLFARSIADLFQTAAEAKSIDLNVNCGGPAMCFADPDKLHKIVGNLISNAIKFTKRGAVTLTVQPSGSEVCLAVADTGEGIPPKSLHRIFERFYQVDGSETRTEGSGIGLSLAKELAELHGGSLTAESELGKGSLFTLRLPKHESDAGVEEPARAESAHGTTDAQAGEYFAASVEEPDDGLATVLVVEDHPEMRRFIAEILSGQFRVVEAENGLDGLQRVFDTLPDVIVADVMMPEMDGLEFSRRLKADPMTAAVPLVYLTAKSTRDDHLAGFDAGADAYLTKPFDPQVLRAQVANVVESRLRLRRAIAAETSPRRSNGEASGQTRPSKFREQLESAVAAHFFDPEFNVTELVRLMHMDRSQLLRKCKKETGDGPADLLRNYRLDKACEFLGARRGNVSEVAYAVGFKSLSHFSQAFRERYGKAPSELIHREIETL